MTENTNYQIIFSIIIGLLFSFSLQLSASAQTSSTSASTAADKRLGILQYTKDGRDFSKLTPEEVKGLGDDDYDKYNEWKLAEKKAKLITVEQRIAEEKEKVIFFKNLADKYREKAITEYQKMIMNFTQLHSKRSTAPIYFTMKEDLKKVLISGEPPELLPQLEPLRAILMSPDSSAPR